MDMSQYLDLFVSETREYLRTVGVLVVDLEKEAGDREKIDALFRAAHSIKGMAASMDFGNITDLAHRLEDLMARVRKDVLAFDSAIADLLLEGADRIEQMVAEVEEGRDGSSAEDLIARIDAYQPAAASPVSVAEQPPPHLPVEPEEGGEPPVRRKSDLGGGEQTVRVRTAILDELITLTGELITNKHRLVNIAEEVRSPRLAEAVTELSRLLRGLHDEVMQVRLMPLAAVTDRFPRVVRDLARQSGKEATLVMEGQEIELDRGILEQLSDPLVHILRNAVDHGLELPDVRRREGKPSAGTVTVRAQRERDQVIITVEDDGRGIDAERIAAVAEERGFISAGTAARLSPQEAFLLTCLPGFSTATEVTSVSGRGVGMDIVRATIHSLCGTIAMESEPGKGTRVILRLPMTAAIINVLLMVTGPITVAVPVMNIQRTLELRRDLLVREEGEERVVLEDEVIPLFRLDEIFTLPPGMRGGGSLPAFICEVKGRKVAIAVDRFLGHQEMFVKPLGRPLGRMQGVAGGAILGDGKVVFVLDVANLFTR